MRVLLQPAYVLHTKPYSDTSLLVHIFTPDYGVLTAIAKGVKRKSSRIKNYLRAFAPLLISWSGKSELVTLTAAEPRSLCHDLSGTQLFSGLYLNELILYLLIRFDPQPELFYIYEQTLIELQQPTSAHEKILRMFEKQLLKLLGYELQLETNSAAQTILSDHYYQFDHEKGFDPCINKNAPDQFLGQDLLAISRNNFEEASTLRAAKRLMRLALKPLLGNRTIKTRELFLVE